MTLRLFGLAVFRLVVGMRGAFVRRIGMLRGPAVSVRVAMRLATTLCPRVRGVWHRPHFPCWPRIVGGAGARPGGRAISIHRVRRTVKTGAPARRRCITGGAIPVTILWTIRTMAGFWTVPIFGAGRHHVMAVEYSWSGTCRNAWPAMVHGGELLTVGAGGMFVPHLVVSGAHVTLAVGPHFLARRASAGSTIR